MGKHIYYISGLGADERVFDFLNLGDFPGTMIKWLDPHRNETLSSYTKRLIAQIDTTQEVLLVGVSFGGIIAQEIAKHVLVEKLIIISSVTGFKEYGWELKLASYTKVYRLFPASVLKWSNLVTADFYFSVKSRKESQLLKAIIEDTDTTFMVWAIHQIMRWRDNPASKKHVVHIHGDGDRIFTNRNMDNVIWIKGGGHFMIVNRANEIAEIISREIQ